MNLRVPILTILVSVTTFICSGQDNIQDNTTSLTKISFLNPGISYEGKIARHQTLFFQGYLAFSGGIGYSDNLGFMSTFSYDPAVTVQYRYYYNSQARQKKGKRTSLNNLNYLSATISDFLSYKDNSISNSQAYSLGALWGMQRNYPKHFSLDLNLGAGYFFIKERNISNSSNFKSNFSIITRLTLGFWLNKKKIK